MYTIVDMLSLVVGVSACLLCVMVAPLGVSGLALPRRTRHSYLALCIVAGWYSIWVGLARSNVLADHPELWGMSQLLSGFAGPLLFIFTRTLLLPEHPISRRHMALLLLGLPGVAICLRVFFYPEVAQSFMLFLDGQQAEPDPIMYGLLALHALELLALVLLANVYILGQFRKPDTPALRQRVLFAALPAIGVLGATLLSTMLPLVSLELSTVGWGPLAVAPTCLLAAYSMRQIQGQIGELEQRHRSMGRYLPESVVQRIIDGEHCFELGGERAVATVLFCDIRGFTPLTQELGPEGTVRFLNRFFTVLNEEVFAHGGIVDKFIGDAMMAVFGFTEGRDAHRALACSEAMLVRLENFNRRWVEEGHSPIRIGIGLHRGEVIHGNIGSATRMDHTVIGDAVNTAARLCERTKDLGYSVVVSGELSRALEADEQERLETIGQEVLRGRAGNTDLLGLVGYETSSTPG